jgi:hypothetical protein
MRSNRGLGRVRLEDLGEPERPRATAPRPSTSRRELLPYALNKFARQHSEARAKAEVAHRALQQRVVGTVPSRDDLLVR